MRPGAPCKMDDAQECAKQSKAKAKAKAKKKKKKKKKKTDRVAHFPSAQNKARDMSALASVRAAVEALSASELRAILAEARGGGAPLREALLRYPALAAALLMAQERCGVLHTPTRALLCAASGEAADEGALDAAGAGGGEAASAAADIIAAAGAGAVAAVPAADAGRSKDATTVMGPS